ncbi:MAG: hypothetical protein J5994_01985 [Ruminococcus sp.]|nr:hypothetical protein [Ruminococcus sp.]
MMTKQEFNCIRGLTDAENQLFYRLKEGEKRAMEPQLREELQKLSAAVSNHKQALMRELEAANEQ